MRVVTPFLVGIVVGLFVGEGVDRLEAWWKSRKGKPDE
jgi:hypothetical protein